MINTLNYAVTAGTMFVPPTDILFLVLSILQNLMENRGR